MGILVPGEFGEPLRKITLTCLCGARNVRDLPYDMVAPDKCDACHRAFARHVDFELNTGMQSFPRAVDPALMALVERFCTNIMESRPTNQDIGRLGAPYIDRWYLARKATVPARSEPPEYGDIASFIPSEIENLYLHRYHRGDADEPHDHPWPNASLVVRGWYRESIYTLDGQLLGSQMRRAGDVVLRTANSIHAILETSEDCLSLFATLPKQREWGFHTVDGFVPWRQFGGNAT